jgi:hypothetical protein
MIALHRKPPPQGGRMKRFAALLALAACLVGATASSALANHSWSTYHWGRTANPFTVNVGNNMTTADWSSHLTAASADWNRSTVAKNQLVAGAAKGKCRPTTGRDEVCNGSYGNNGWLGLATIWLSGGHIVQGTVKVNDTYFNQSYYNNPNEKRHVVCQEIGHTWGLDHQDESGASLNTCMDYFSNTGANANSTTSTTVNQGDLDQLLCIYDAGSNGRTLTTSTHSCTGTGHVDSSNTVSAAAGSAGAAAGEVPAWANPSESVYIDHLANGQTQVTWVRWANPIHSWGG